MLPAANRMRSAADFTETTRRGRKVARGCVVVYVHVGGADGVADTDEPTRLGLTVGKAVGGSVQRHRAARRIRGVMSPLMSGMPPGTRIVVRALKGADTDPGLAVDLTGALAAALEGRGR